VAEPKYTFVVEGHPNVAVFVPLPATLIVPQIRISLLSPVAFNAAAPAPMKIDVETLVSAVVPVPAYRPAVYPSATLLLPLVLLFNAA
jgi:hypothetical protein